MKITFRTFPKFLWIFFQYKMKGNLMWIKNITLEMLLWNLFLDKSHLLLQFQSPFDSWNMTLLKKSVNNGGHKSWKCQNICFWEKKISPRIIFSLNISSDAGNKNNVTFKRLLTYLWYDDKNRKWDAIVKWIVFLEDSV